MRGGCRVLAATMVTVANFQLHHENLARMDCRILELVLVYQIMEGRAEASGNTRKCVAVADFVFGGSNNGWASGWSAR